MSCAKIRRKLPGYLDGALAAGEHATVREHLEQCRECRIELERYWKLGALLAGLEPAAPPADLVFRIRVQASRQGASRPWTERLWSRASLIFDNVLKPLAVPATGGFVTALLVFALVFQNLLVGVPLGAVPNDLPINLVQPARLLSLAPFPVSDLAQGSSLSGTDTLMLEATVNARGEAVNYQILYGRDDAGLRRQLDQVMLFSRFRPQMSFGRPTEGGRVVLSFSQVRVRG
jgi:putative zinc finger protein